jgi:hypothetical protein
VVGSKLDRHGRCGNVLPIVWVNGPVAATQETLLGTIYGHLKNLWPASLVSG